MHRAKFSRHFYQMSTKNLKNEKKGTRMQNGGLTWASSKSQSEARIPQILATLDTSGFCPSTASRDDHSDDSHGNLTAASIVNTTRLCLLPPRCVELYPECWFLALPPRVNSFSIHIALLQHTSVSSLLLPLISPESTGSPGSERDGVQACRQTSRQTNK